MTQNISIYGRIGFQAFTLKEALEAVEPDNTVEAEIAALLHQRLAELEALAVHATDNFD